jgi:hypothetical protein
MRYSPSTNSFYPEALNYPSLPSDIITIDDTIHQAIMARKAGEGYYYNSVKMQLEIKPVAPFSYSKWDPINYVWVNDQSDIDLFISKVKTFAKDKIDSTARALVKPYSELRDVYELKYTSAKEWKESGFAGTAPTIISSWTESINITAQQGAEIIIEKYLFTKEKIIEIEQLRMSKNYVDAFDTEKDISDYFRDVLKSLDDIKKQIE